MATSTTTAQVDSTSATLRFQKNIVATLQQVSPQLAALHASRYRLLNNADTELSPLHCSRCGSLGTSIRIASASHKSSKRRARKKVSSSPSKFLQNAADAAQTTAHRRIAIRATCSVCGHVNVKPCTKDIQLGASDSCEHSALRQPPTISQIESSSSYAPVHAQTRAQISPRSNILPSSEIALSIPPITPSKSLLSSTPNSSKFSSTSNAPKSSQHSAPATAPSLSLKPLPAPPVPGSITDPDSSSPPQVITVSSSQNQAGKRKKEKESLHKLLAKQQKRKREEQEGREEHRQGGLAAFLSCL